MEQLTDLEDQLQQWSVPSDVRDALRSAIDAVARDGVSLVGEVSGDLVTLSVRGQPAAVYLSPSRVSAALAPADAERAHRADSAIGLDKDSDQTWIVHCRYGRLDPSRLNTVAALMVKALRRFAPRPQPRQAAVRTPRRRSAAAAKPDSPRRTAATQEERRRAADAAIPRCPVPGCNLPMVGGSCGFHD